MSSERPDWDTYFVELSNAVAKRATCDRGRSGCVIVKQKRVLTTGYVGSPAGMPHCDEAGHTFKTVRHGDGTESQHCVRTCHAEENAIVQAAKFGTSLDGATLYCKMTPCASCARMILNAGITRVVCQKDYHRGHETKEMFEKTGVSLEILGGLEEYDGMAPQKEKAQLE